MNKSFTEKDLLLWLMEGDPAMVSLTKSYLLEEPDPSSRAKILSSGWGKQLLSGLRGDGTWSDRFYQPKWISTHYSLLDLRHLEPEANHPGIQKAVQKILLEEKGPDGGINCANSIAQSDLCVNGMFLYYGCYFMAPEKQLHSVIDFVLDAPLSDGGFNCRFNRSGAHHSSLHSTISMLEGLSEYLLRGYQYRFEEVRVAIENAKEFLLIHHLFRSDRTGEIIHEDFLKLRFPARWYFNILRALYWFAYYDQPWDKRLAPSLESLLSKRTKDGKWKLASKIPGKIHFEMEKAGKPSRMITYQALKVLKKYSAWLEST